MKRFTPRKTLLLLLAVAAAILTTGTYLARREEMVRKPDDREYFHQLAQALQRETDHLLRIYETRLRSLAREADGAQKQNVQDACAHVVGVLQFSWVEPPDRSRKNVHVVVSPGRGPRLPEPLFETSALPDSGIPALLPIDLLSTSSNESGWLDDPGKPLFFWYQRPAGELTVLLIDAQAVGEAMDSWLAGWMKDSWPEPAQQGYRGELLGTHGTVLAGGHPGVASVEAPDILLPIQTRFGVWQLASWDRRELRVSYHTPTLAASACLAVIVAFTGIVVSAQQRHALQHAERRVSFVNRVSHELRTPLTNILLNLDLTHELIEEVAAPEATQGLTMATEEARRLSRLIANVLTFSSIERGSSRSPLRVCAPAMVLSAVAQQFIPLFARRSLTLSLRNEAIRPCLLDSDALAQIVGNLLSNIEKYVPGGSAEMISRYDNAHLVVQITDNGPGIPPADFERVFLPFERLNDSVNEGATGTGLGLAIARELAAGMGGTLRALPVSKGTCFALRVPAPALPSPTPAAA